MKKFLKQFLVFIFYATAVYLVLLVIWGEFMPNMYKKNLNYSPGSYGHMYSRIREAEKVTNMDILFIGSSHAYRGFDTRIAEEYGFKSFNLGSSAQTPVQTKLLLEEYLDKLKPKMIVYEVYPYTLMNDGVESSLDIIANGNINHEVLNMAFSLNNIKTYNSLLYGYYRVLFKRNKDFEENTVIGNDTYIPGGFVEKKMAYNQTPSGTEVKETEWIPIHYQVAALDKIIGLAKEKGIKLVLVQSPVTKAEFKKYINNDAIDSFYSAKAVYYNFNQSLALSDSTDFYNSDHLNQNGVRIFNNAFFHIIKK